MAHTENPEETELRIEVSNLLAKLDTRERICRIGAIDILNRVGSILKNHQKLAQDYTSFIEDLKKEYNIVNEDLVDEEYMAK